MNSNSKKTIIIPGFGESAKDKEYKTLKKQIRMIYPDSVVDFYNPIWDRKTIKHWINDFKIKFKGINSTEFILMGFSLGSYIALTLTKELTFKKVILASLSPYFKENVKNIPADAAKFMGKKRMRDFADNTLPSSINTKVSFLFGDQDWKDAIIQAEKLAEKYNGKFILIKNTGHELTEEYIKKITTEA